jgi:hypothetical protein
MNFLPGIIGMHRIGGDVSPPRAESAMVSAKPRGDERD